MKPTTRYSCFILIALLISACNLPRSAQAGSVDPIYLLITATPTEAVCPDGSVGDCLATAQPVATVTIGGSAGSQTLPTPTAPPPATAVTACYDSASLVADVTVPDGSIYLPNSAFNKTWRLKNTGTCTWDPRYKLIHVGGPALGAASTGFVLPDVVAPGQQIDLTVAMIAPAAAGNYQSNWKLQNPQAQPFGVGQSSGPFWVYVVVQSLQTTNITGVVYQDINQNGVYDLGEPLMGNRQVLLMAGDACHVKKNRLATASSGSDGRYSFSGNFDGNYCIGLVGNGGLDDVVGIKVASGQSMSSVNLHSSVPSGSISGWVWSDHCVSIGDGSTLLGDCVSDGHGGYRADGMLQATESYISGVTVLLRWGQCVNNSNVAVAAVTDSSGRYIFTNLFPGTYCVSIEALSPVNISLLMPGQWTFPQVLTQISYQEITLQAGNDVTPVNFGWDYQLQ